MPERAKRPPDGKGQGNISAETSKALQARSESFMHMTQGKGKPMVYGHGKPPGQEAKR